MCARDLRRRKCNRYSFLPSTPLTCETKALLAGKLAYAELCLGKAQRELKVSCLLGRYIGLVPLELCDTDYCLVCTAHKNDSVEASDENTTK